MSKKHRFQMSDFDIKRIQERVYDGIGRLVYATITNKVTGTVFEDWVTPAQLRSLSCLNDLIKWD